METILALIGIGITIVSGYLGYKIGRSDYQFKKSHFEKIHTENKKMEKRINDIDIDVGSLKNMAMKADLHYEKTTDTSNLNEPIEWIFLQNCIEIESMAASVFYKKHPDWEHEVIAVNHMYEDFRDEGYINEDQMELLLKIRKVKRMITDGFNVQTTRAQVIDLMDICVALKTAIKTKMINLDKDSTVRT